MYLGYKNLELREKENIGDKIKVWVRFPGTCMEKSALMTERLATLP